MALSRNNPTTPGSRIDHPNIFSAHLKIIVQPLLQPRKGIFRRKDLDTNVGCLPEHWTAGPWQLHHADVWYPISFRLYRHAEFRKRRHVQLFAPAAKPEDKLALDIAMIELAYVTLQKYAIQIVAIRTVGSCQIFLFAHKCGCTHPSILTAQAVPALVRAVTRARHQ